MNPARERVSSAKSCEVLDVRDWDGDGGASGIGAPLLSQRVVVVVVAVVVVVCGAGCRAAQAKPSRSGWRAGGSFARPATPLPVRAWAPGSFLSALPVLSLERIDVTPHLCDICRGKRRGGVLRSSSNGSIFAPLLERA